MMHNLTILTCINLYSTSRIHILPIFSYIAFIIHFMHTLHFTRLQPTIFNLPEYFSERNLTD